VINKSYQFNYLYSGENTNPPLLFLHGFLGNEADWEAIISELRTDFYCLALDLPGHGKTRFLKDQSYYSLERCAQGIMELINQLELQKCNLIGYSMGGRLALYLAVHYPDMWNKIILESASPGLKSVSEQEERWRHDLNLAIKLEKEDLNNFLHSWYKQPIFNSLRRYPEFQALFDKRLNNNKFELAHALRGMSVGKQLPLWNNLKDIELPILLVTGELDYKFNLIMHEMSDLLPKSGLRLVHGCGHTVHFENPKMFIDIVKEFLLY